MSIPNHVSTTEVVLLSRDLTHYYFDWRVGRLCQLSLRKDKTEYNSSHESIKYCLTQIVISCFTSFC